MIPNWPSYGQMVKSLIEGCLLDKKQILDIGYATRRPKVFQIERIAELYAVVEVLKSKLTKHELYYWLTSKNSRLKKSPMKAIQMGQFEDVLNITCKGKNGV